jgi:hypothetical protein
MNRPAFECPEIVAGSVMAHRRIVLNHVPFQEMASAVSRELSRASPFAIGIRQSPKARHHGPAAPAGHVDGVVVPFS